MVVWNSEKAVVLDVAVCGDSIHPNTDHELKVHKYSVLHPEVAPYVRTLTGLSPTFSAFVANWRGVISPLSAQDLLKLGLRKSDLTLLSVSVVEQGTVLHRMFQQTTSRAAGARRR